MVTHHKRGSGDPGRKWGEVRPRDRSSINSVSLSYVETQKFILTLDAPLKPENAKSRHCWRFVELNAMSNAGVGVEVSHVESVVLTVSSPVVPSEPNPVASERTIRKVVSDANESWKV